MGGAPYPDSFYSEFCNGGIYHNISEDTHWTPFLNATINYINKQPKPWNNATEKLVVFLMGVTSHQIADVLWHSLGIDQGFLTTMGYEARSQRPLPSLYFLADRKTKMAALASDWLRKSPLKPLNAIQRNLTGLKVPTFSAKFVFRAGRKTKMAAPASDWLTFFTFPLKLLYRSRQNLTEINIATSATSACQLPHNPLYINCTKPKAQFNRRTSQKEEINGYFVQPALNGLTTKDIERRKICRGVHIKPGEQLSQRIMDVRKLMNVQRTKYQEAGEKVKDKRTEMISYDVNQTEALFGWSLAKGDFDKDGNEDLVIGAPFYGEDENPYMGRVFVVYLASLDLNQDGNLDLAVGAPAMDFGDPLGYRIKYCNLGYSLSTADVTGDGHEDLIIGSPYWSKNSTFTQSGFIAALPSSKTYSGPMTVAVEILKWRVEGDQPYGWFGHKLHSKGGILFVDQPYFRLCNDPTKFSDNDTCIQSVGKLTMMNFGSKYPVKNGFAIQGEKRFDMVGQAVDIGDPFGNGSVVISYGVPGEDVDGEVLTLPWKFSQGGVVHLVEIHADGSMTQIARYESDREYSRFGTLILFEDINEDGIDDLIISAPFRNDYETEIVDLTFKGKVYGFIGGKNFSTGNATISNKCDLISPCPGKIADVIFDTVFHDEDKSYFGDHGLMIRSKNQVPFKCLKLITKLHTLFVISLHLIPQGKDTLQASYRKPQLQRDKHEDAFMGGAPYPDSFYSDLCNGGIYHNISEDSQWTPFLNATINYINKQPKPWNNATEKLVVFLMGITSHQVADVLWQSLGIDQGFLSTMGFVNFHGSIPKAHQAGDFGKQDTYGGDIVNMYALDIDYLDPDQYWYVPVDDLYNIYNEMYGKNVIDKETIESCSTLMLVGAIAEFFASAELFQEVADTSPFLVDNLQSYFLGGMEDMAGWTFNKWHDVANMLENGTSACQLPHNPLYINCTKPKTEITRRNSGREEINGYFVQPPLNGLTIKDIDIRKIHRGVHIKPGEQLSQRIRDVKKLRKIRLLKSKENREKVNDERRVRINYNVNETEALLGWSLTKGDFDKDGNEDLVIGAPFYGEDENPYMGRVFVVYSSENGLPSFHGKYDYFDPLNLNNLTYGYQRILSGFPKKQSRFGYSMVSLDLNQDGNLDLAVGAPAISFDDPLGYHGAVYVYFGEGESKMWSIPNITVTCQTKYCNLGYSLSTADVTGDGHEDLVIGSPYWSKNSTFTQSGFIAALPSNKTYSGPMTIAVETLKWRVEGDQPYGWFGYNLHSKGGILFVDQPYFRLCSDPSKFSENDTCIQSVGKLTMMNFGSKYPVKNGFAIQGEKRFDMLGQAVDIGDPFGNGSVVIAYGVPGEDVDGVILTLPWKLSQGGVVHLAEVQSDGTMSQIARYESDRRYARFGSLILFEDINEDGIDDLLISAPFRNDDASEIIDLTFTGKTYGFLGGKNFSTGNATVSKKCDVISPCPGKLAAVVFDTYYYDEDKSYFGDHGLVIRTKNQTQMVISASRNTDTEYAPYFPESGKVYVFNLKWDL
ncbi:hypothetical protein FSP39_014629 [Pinctada imbricata]|uniref:Phosphatidylinositol-glycan-specific phospholipase D n=1 Tax=Pinctada imbricata TaxID=66713 RepID=A0AA88XKU3_PINIB|nr:hypothetical protein FSP39_014629 [Pinctada imbricata]